MIKMSTPAILGEIESYIERFSDTDNVLEAVDELLEAVEDLPKTEYDKVTKRLAVEVLDIERFVLN